MEGVYDCDYSVIRLLHFKSADEGVYRVEGFKKNSHKFTKGYKTEPILLDTSLRKYNQVVLNEMYKFQNDEYLRNLMTVISEFHNNNNNNNDNDNNSNNNNIDEYIRNLIIGESQNDNNNNNNYNNNYNNITTEYIIKLLTSDSDFQSNVKKRNSNKKKVASRLIFL